MDAGLRLAWTEIVTAHDYEQHMCAIGQAQAAAALTEFLIARAAPPPDGRLVIVGAGTGQMLDFLDPALFRPFKLICTDLNRSFLATLAQRLEKRGIRAHLMEDDIEHTALEPGPDLLIATLVLEHIDWRAGVKAFAQLGAPACGVVMQENPPGMLSAVTPGRPIPSSIARAVEAGHPTLVPRDQLLSEFAAHGYECEATCARDVADGKQLLAMLFRNRNHLL